MNGDSLKIGSMQSPSPLDSLGQVLGQPPNEKPLVVLPVGLPMEDGEVPDIKKKLPERTSHFSRVQSIDAVWKLLPWVRIYSGFRCKMLS
ncbi:MAG: hypothetical protein WA197_01970 [Candidatus Acidiferrales bacterium]